MISITRPFSLTPPKMSEHKYLISRFLGFQVSDHLPACQVKIKWRPLFHNGASDVTCENLFNVAVDLQHTEHFEDFRLQLRKTITSVPHKLIKNLKKSKKKEVALRLLAGMQVDNDPEIIKAAKILLSLKCC